MAHLTAEGLVKTYKGRNVVDGVDLEIADHSVVGLLGPNGAGKTTSFLMVAGLLRPDAGRVYLNGADITHLPIHKRAVEGITYLPQEPSVFRKLSVVENVALVLENRGLTGKALKEHAHALLEDLNLEHVASQPGQSLSGGERRRVEVARALASEPQFILLDEPFAGVDPIAVGELQRIIRSLKERGIGVFISDHNVRETLTVCDHAYILNSGKVLEKGRPEELAKSSTARRIYLGEDFRL